MRVAIIGAGWYGCHIGSSLMGLGFEVVIFEKNNQPINFASANNQFRLHLGFHYARHHGTRFQSREGFYRFTERYPTLSRAVDRNIYAVPMVDSLIDFQTYKSIIASSGIDFTEVGKDDEPLLKDVDGVLLTAERVILTSKAREYFKSRLGSSLLLGVNVEAIAQNDNYVEVNGQRFDYVIDATWGKASNLPARIFYEPTLLLYYETKENFPAITFVDGPLASIYPTEENEIYTLSSVPHTPLGRYDRADDARRCLEQITSSTVRNKQNLMEMQIIRNVPNFLDFFRFVGIQLSMKTKIDGRSDDRSCYVFKNKRMISVLSGKIDTVFFATERIISLIEGESVNVTNLTVPNVREQIISLESLGA